MKVNIDRFDLAVVAKDKTVFLIRNHYADSGELCNIFNNLFTRKLQQNISCDSNENADKP